VSEAGADAFQGLVQFQEAKGARLCAAHMLDRGQMLNEHALQLRLLLPAEAAAAWDANKPAAARRPRPASGDAPHAPAGDREVEYTPMLLVRFRLLQTGQNFRTVRALLAAVAPVAFLELKPGGEGCARMESAAGASTLLRVLQTVSNGGRVVGAAETALASLGKVEDIALLEGDEEREVPPPVLNGHVSSQPPY